MLRPYGTAVIPDRKRTTASQRRRLQQRRFRLLITLVATALGLCVFAWWWVLVPDIEIEPWLSGRPPQMWAYKAQQESAAAANQDGKARRGSDIKVDGGQAFIGLDALPMALKTTVVVAEDVSFFDHGAIDSNELTVAVGHFLRGGRLRGASTITQQLAKNLFLSDSRSLWRKINELRLALWLERKLSKQRILELYLNIIELGPGIYGVDAAARAYFHKSAQSLSQADALALAASIPAPRNDNPRSQSAAWRRRIAIIGQHVDGLGTFATYLGRRVVWPKS